MWNRSADKAAQFLASLPADLADRVTIASSIGEAIASPDAVVVSMVSNDAALQAISAEIVPCLGPTGVHLCMSTVSPSISDRMQAMHAERGSAYVSCPVFGRPPAAAARKLIAVAAGERDAFERVRPLLDLTAQKVVFAGEKAGSSNTLKLCGNYMILAVIQAEAEAFGLAEAKGIDRSVAYDLLVGPEGVFSSLPIMASYGAMVAGRNYPLGFTARNGLKDCNLVLEAANEGGVDMPIAGIVKDRMATVVASLKEGEEKDWAAFADLVTVEKKSK